MRKLYAFIGALVIGMSAAFAQINNPDWTETQVNYTPSAVVLPQSPLSVQVLFVGGEDMVQTTATYGNAAGEVPAKQWHDFIGFTPATEAEGGLGWVSVNHERIQQDDNIGDGGGMTVFKVERDEDDNLVIVDQTLADGRTGTYFNVDFVNTVGATGMNCGGITSVVDGRIWTAEEWFRSSNSSIADRNLGNFVIGEGTIANDSVSAYASPNGFPGFNGDTLDKYQNYNYMVEIDPREAVAVRKQYNWGRQGFEGGCVMPDNQTVYLGVDATPAFWLKFVADQPGDFTSGQLYAFKEDETEASDRWKEIDVTNKGYLTVAQQAIDQGCTMYNRIEWVVVDTTSGYVYWTETGRDNPASRWVDESAEGATHSSYTMARAMAQGTHPDSSDYVDYYGRVVKYDPSTETTVVTIEGGPDFAADSVSLADYQAAGITKHLSNPDGLNAMVIGGQSYLIICEDLNGRSHGRVPLNLTTNRTCEMFLLDLSIENPTPEDLIRITATPFGAEITGACPTPDGKSILVNSQHPSDDQALNIYPYNNSLTVAINGFDKLVESTVGINDFFAADENAFKVYPNPVARTLYFEEATDAAIVNLQGQQVRVVRNSNKVDVSDLTAGVYTITDLNTNISRKLIIE